MQIISVTGTKGKTTTVRLVDHLLRKLNFSTIRVDTDGHYVNGKKKSGYAESIRYWGLVPNVCPGRYLYEAQHLADDKTVALLETAIGSSSLDGMGYKRHTIGLFTNIYDDHITKVRIKNRTDIYKAKRFIFQRLEEDGTFVYNSDDQFLSGKLSQEKLPQRKIAVGNQLSHESAFLKSRNIFFKIDGSTLEVRKMDDDGKRTKRTLLQMNQIPCTFQGTFLPNVYNVSFALALLYGAMGELAFFANLSTIVATLKRYHPDKHGGRLVVVPDKRRDINIIIDFAHEKESLRHVALLARSLAKRQVVGVLRIDPSRINEDIIKTARYIRKQYDFIYIYDKVDGVKSFTSRLKAQGRNRGVGETAGIFALGLKKMGYPHYQVILNEEAAFKQAFRSAQAGDVIIYIGNGDDHKRTYEFVKQLVQ